MGRLTKALVVGTLLFLFVPFFPSANAVTVTNTFTAVSSGGNFPASSTVKVEGLSGGADTTCTITTGGLASASQSCTFDLGTPVVFQGLSSQGTSTNQWSAVPTTYGLVGNWMLDENSGTLAFDGSGNGNTGTLTNSPTWQTGANCKFGSCLSFASASIQYVTIADSSSIDTTSAITLSGWIYMTSNPSGVKSIMSKSDGGGTPQFEFRADTTPKLNIFTTIGGSGTSLTGTTTFSLNTWYYVAYTYDGSNMRLFVNGVQEAVVTATGSIGIQNTQALNIAARKGGTQAVFDGRMDDLRIYNHALSASEISELYSATDPNITFSDTTGGNTHTVTYYHQWGSPTFTIAAKAQSTFDSGLSALTVSANNLGASITTCNITPTSGQPSNNCASTNPWIDAGATVSSTIGGAATGSRWACSTCNFGTGTSPSTVNYYHQYAITPSFGSFTYTSLGTTRSASTTQQYADANTAITSTGIFSCTVSSVTNATNIYQFTASGIQLFGNASASSVQDFTTNTNRYIGFTATKFHGILCVKDRDLTVDKITDNQTPLSYTQSSDAMTYYFKGSSTFEIDFLAKRGSTGAIGGTSTTSSSTTSSQSSSGINVNIGLAAEIIGLLALATTTFYYIAGRKGVAKKFEREINRSGKEPKDKRKKGFF